MGWPTTDRQNRRRRAPTPTMIRRRSMRSFRAFSACWQRKRKVRADSLSDQHSNTEEKRPNLLPDFTLRAVADRIKNGQAQKIIVMSGAGISTCSIWKKNLDKYQRLAYLISDRTRASTPRWPNTDTKIRNPSSRLIHSDENHRFTSYIFRVVFRTFSKLPRSSSQNTYVQRLVTISKNCSTTSACCCDHLRRFVSFF